ncbi:MAG: hypothetical protein ACO26C_08550, partial [Ilumatobacteraceae bacterium]
MRRAPQGYGALQHGVRGLEHPPARLARRQALDLGELPPRRPREQPLESIESCARIRRASQLGRHHRPHLRVQLGARATVGPREQRTVGRRVAPRALGDER